MADNVIANAGSGGATFASDDIAGVQYPRSKVVWGPDGTANDTDDAAGKRLPVKLAEALPAGTNNIGDVDVLTLPALVAGTANIGDVDVLTVPAPLSTTGGGTEAAALRVTLANDSTGLVSVDDNGGSLTIDGTVTANAGTGTFAVDSELPAAAALADAAANPTVPTVGADLLGFNGTTWDRVRTANTGRLQVDVITGGGGASLADEAAFTEGATSFTPVGGVLNDTITSDPTEDQAACARITPKRAIHVNLRDNAGGEVSVGGGTQYDEDTAHVTGDKLTLAGAVRRDTAASGTDVTGDRATINVDANGKLWTNAEITSALPAGTNNIGDVDVLSIAAGDNNIGNVDVVTLPALVAGTANIGDVDVLTVPAPLSTTGTGTEATALRVTVATDSTGVLSVDDNGGSLTVDGTVTANLAAGANNIGDVDVLTLPAIPAGTNDIGNVGLAPRTSGGLTISRVISAASTNATSAKASAGQVFGWYLSNINAAVRYLKLYNKASAPTVGTDTPVMTIAIPGNAAGAGATVEFTNGIAFATGIAYALTTGVADSDTGAVAANEIVVNLLLK